MKNTIKLAALGVCLAAGIAQSQAASAITYTNFTERTITISLTAEVQSPNSVTSKAAIGNKNILTALGIPTGAKLLLLQGVGVVARQTTPTNTIDWAISSTHLAQVTGDTVVANTATMYSVDQYVVSVSGLAAQVAGFTTKTIATGAVSATVAGPGEVGTEAAVFKGTVSVSAATTTKINAAKYVFKPVPVS